MPNPKPLETQTLSPQTPKPPQKPQTTQRNTLVSHDHSHLCCVQHVVAELGAQLRQLLLDRVEAVPGSALRWPAKRTLTNVMS